MPEDDRPTVTVEIDGEEREIQLPDGYLPESQVRDAYVPKDTVEDLVKDRLRRATRGRYRPEELLEDEDFLSRVVEANTDRLKEMLGVEEGTKPDPEKLRQQLIKSEVEPLKEKLSERDQQIRRLRVNQLEAEVAKYGGLHEDMVEPVQAWIRGRVKYDEEYGDWFVTDADGEFEATTRHERGRPPFKTVHELLDEIQQAGEKKSWFRSEVRSGIGYKGAGGRMQTIGVDDFEKMSSRERRELWDRDPEAYRELSTRKQERAEEKLIRKGA